MPRSDLARLVCSILCTLLFATILGAQPSWFRRGDAGGDGRVDIDDALRIQDFLFLGGPGFACFDAADADDDDLITNSDATLIIAFSVGGGPPPPAPGPFVCGPDPAPGLFDCASYSCAFIRGDANGDGFADALDAVAINDFLFLGTPLACLDAADANDDGAINASDAILAAAGGPFPLPGQLICGPDYTADALDCQMYVSPTVFLRGDADGDVDVDADDAQAINDFLFMATPLECEAGADANGDGMINVQDPVFILNFTGGGPPPPPPFPICGIDPLNVFPCEMKVCAFIRGDADGDGQVDDGDAMFIADFLFVGGPAPGCLDTADANDDGIVNNFDVLAVLAFPTGGPIPAPGPHVCGIDPTPDAVGCADYECRIPHDFRRGDCNTDGLYDIADAIFGLDVLFPPAGPPADCLDACDSNDDGLHDIADPIYVLANLFSAGPAPPAPFPECGYDPTPVDHVGCEDYTQLLCP